MKINGFSGKIPAISLKKTRIKTQSSKNSSIQAFEKSIKDRNLSNGIHLSKNTSKKLMKDYANYYFHQGKELEDIKQYKQAISAYEQSNSAEPDISKAQSVNQARNKAYGGK